MHQRIGGIAQRLAPMAQLFGSRDGALPNASSLTTQARHHSKATMTLNAPHRQQQQRVLLQPD